MGVSKGEGGGRWSPPNGWRSLVLGERGPCRIWRSGGFPNFPGKSSPSSPSFPLTTLFSPLNPFLQSFHPSNTFLQLSSSGLYQPLLPPLPSFSSSDPLFTPQILLKPYRTLSEHLRSPSIGSPKRPFLGLFRVFSQTPQKGQKPPF